MKNFIMVEKKWQEIWEKSGIFRAVNDAINEKYYVLEMYPYPSGELHMGHVRNYILGDVVARYKRMMGFNVLHPIGWDAFGLPTENAAFSRGIEPADWNTLCVGNMTKQFKSLGLSYDWNRVIDTSNADYYKWAQWFLIRFWERGILYKSKSSVNWCIGCNTVLANEQVEDGKCSRCDSSVIEKSMDQWFLKITDYAERLWNDLSLLTEWPLRVIAMQKHWLGKDADSNYKIRDWCISRQRYWGAPIPFVSCQKCGTQPIPDEQLPVLLPPGADISPGWPPPLARISNFVHTTCPKCGGSAERITDTMDTFVFSAWYFLRFTDPNNGKLPFDPDKASYWMPVDQYVGGIEHATVHLIYARFFHKVLYDMGMVSSLEPFTRLFTQGMVNKDGKKMSKSKGNVVSPDDMIERYGADATRIYVMFMGPPELDVEWSDKGIKGSSRFLNRIADIYASSTSCYDAGWRDKLANAMLGEKDIAFRKMTHQTIRNVTESIEKNFHFHTAISAIMVWVSAWESYSSYSDKSVQVISEALETMALLISPLAPHIAEEMWQRLGFKKSICFQDWPVWSEELCQQQSFKVVIQVNGKTRTVIEFAKEDSQNQVKVTAMALESTKLADIKERSATRIIFVPGKLINFIT